MRGILKNKPLIIMLIAILLLGILAFVTSADRSVSWIESTLGSVIQPVQSFAAKASNGIISFVQKVFKTSDADKELEQLQVRMAQLEQAADEKHLHRSRDHRQEEAQPLQEDRQRKEQRQMQPGTLHALTSPRSAASPRGTAAASAPSRGGSIS